MLKNNQSSTTSGSWQVNSLNEPAGRHPVKSKDCRFWGVALETMHRYTVSVLEMTNPFSKFEVFEKTIDPHAEPLPIFEDFPNTPIQTSMAAFLPEGTRLACPANRSDKGCKKIPNGGIPTYAVIHT
jgi:hypothetical protein